MRGLIQSALNNGNGQYVNQEFALPSSSNVASNNFSTQHGTPRAPNSTAFSSLILPDPTKIVMPSLFPSGASIMASGSASYPSMRSAAGPSSTPTAAQNNGQLLAELIAATSGNGPTPNGMMGNSVPSGSGNSSTPGGGLSSSSLFNALQQEVAEETRLAAINAMTQRLMNTLDGNDPFSRLLSACP